MKRTRTTLLLWAAVSFVSVLVSPALASRASQLYKLGQKAEASGSTAQAFVYYSQAMAADPKNARYRQSAEAIGPMAALEVKANPEFYLPSTTDATSPQAAAASHELDLSPEAVFDSITARELAASRELLPPAHLDPKPGVQDYQLEGDYKSLFQQVAARLNLQVVFDSDYEAGRRLRFRLDQTGPRETLHTLEAATHSFIVPISPKAFLVAQDTDAKRKELEQTESLSVPIPSVLTVQEITEIGQAIKQAVGVDKIFWDSQVNEIVLRDRVSKVQAAESVLHDLINYRGQVAIDLEFIELSEADMQQLGVDLQTSFPITFLGQLVNGQLTGTTIPLSQLAKFSLGRMFGVGLTNVDVVAQMTSAGARNLLHTTIVSVENQKATFHAGSKYPIITSQYVGAVTTGGQVYSPTPSFTFEDLGIVINVTPHVHGAGEITLDLDTEYKILGAAAVNGIPIISSRKLQSTVRLKADQWAVVAGLTSESKSRAVSGPAFLSNVPLLGHIISHYTGNKNQTYVIVSMKPHVLSLPPAEQTTHPVYVGSETRSITPL